MTKLGQMVLKGVNGIHNDKTRSNGPVRSQFWYIIQKLGQMVLKGVNWAHNERPFDLILSLCTLLTPFKTI